MSFHRPRKTVIRRMEQFSRQLLIVPEHVIVDVSPMTNRMSSMFNASIEFVFDSIIEALNDRTAVAQYLRR